MDEARDEVYCHLMARRSVATAALRLGLERMSEEALDALAGVLLSYLERVGETLAMGVEASGRSSAHCNILDCLRAVEQCTVPAVQRVHMDVLLNADDNHDPNNPSIVTNSNNTNSGDSSNSTFRMDPTETMSWKGLATFCFGPNWNKPMKDDEKADGTDVDPENGTREHPTGGGGKVGPSSLSADGGPDSMMMAALGGMLGGQGWHAPFPDEIVAFPVTRQHDTANPVHASLIRTADSLHIHETYPPSTTEKSPSESKQAAEEDNDSFLPDVIFHRWGEIGNISSLASDGKGASAGTKRKRDEEEQPTQQESDVDSKMKANGGPPSKKSKAEPSSETKAAEDEEGAVDHDEDGHDEEDECHPNYVPRHFPSFPRPSDLVGPMVADDGDDEDGETKKDQEGSDGMDETKKPLHETAGASSTTEFLDEAEFEPTLKVRTALVRLGRPWGTIVDANGDAENEFLATAKKFQVASGPSSTGTAASGSNDTAAEQQLQGAHQLKPQIMPLGRASGSRVSRILEGSMDSYTT